jgi:hypothetical protein
LIFGIRIRRKTMAIKMIKKTLYIFTDDRVPGSLEYRGGNTFIYRYNQSVIHGHYSVFSGIAINGDAFWDPTEENIHACAQHIMDDKASEINEQRQEINEKKKESKVSFFKRLFGGKS